MGHFWGGFSERRQTPYVARLDVDCQKERGKIPEGRHSSKVQTHPTFFVTPPGGWMNKPHSQNHQSRLKTFEHLLGLAFRPSPQTDASPRRSNLPPPPRDTPPPLSKTSQSPPLRKEGCTSGRRMYTPGLGWQNQTGTPRKSRGGEG